MATVLYSRLSPDALRAFLAQQSDFVVQQDCVVRNKDQADLIITATRSREWPWRVEVKVRPWADGSEALRRAVVQHLTTHADVTTERAALSIRSESLRLRNVTLDTAWKTLWPHIDAAAHALKYAECSASDLDALLASAADTLSIWSAGLAGVRISVKQRHTDLIVITIEQVETADDLSRLAPDVVSEYAADVQKQRRALIDAADKLANAAATKETGEEPGPYPLWSRSALALRLDFWRWMYWRAASTGKTLDAIITEKEYIRDTVYGWRKSLVKYFDEERLREWEPPHDPPANFEIEAVVAALHRSVKN
jgi:hypothetical protein